MNASDDYEDRLADRRDARLRALGTRSPHCCVPGCQERDPLALTGAYPNIFCREHRADTQERAWIEQHHPAGRNNDPCTIPVPANEHAALSEHQALWERDVLRNPNASPLLRMAGWLSGWLDILRVMIDRAIGQIPAALLRLDQVLTDHHGPEWWNVLGWKS